MAYLQGMKTYEGHQLRKGRFSETGRSYLITFVTRNREKHFTDPALAMLACRRLYQTERQDQLQNWCYVVMPDHIHWLFSLREGDVSKAVKMIKGSLSHQAGTRLWQKGFHDRAIRKEADLLPTARYVVANPLRAGLVRSVRDYPYWNAAWL
ncbi:transposase [Alcanivorax sp.]|uniref:REP-associated tyrosine transposase n=1 Tax=Alcanivorax sp. TaxID=1872427 RepID=UPI0025C113AD|nr:transposase [Alcanivorax sp.]